MRKLLCALIIYISFSFFGCQSSSDEYTFAQKIEFNDYVGIVLIDEQLSIFENEYNHMVIEYMFSEVIYLKGSTNSREKITLIHSSEKESITYCVYENNRDLFYDCFNTKTEDYVKAANFYIIIGYYDPNNEEVLGVRCIELLDGYNESLSILEQTESIQSIILRYTSVIDALESIQSEANETIYTSD